MALYVLRYTVIKNNSYVTSILFVANITGDVMEGHKATVALTDMAEPKRLKSNCYIFLITNNGKRVRRNTSFLF